MRSKYPLRSLILAGLPVLLLCSSLCRADADIVTKNNGDNIKGIILRDADGDLTVLTDSGTLTISAGDVKDIHREGDIENILMTADIYRDKGENIKAYYLYQKAARLDPDNEDAVRGMATLEDQLRGNEEDPAWTEDHRRIQTSSGQDSDKAILRDNSASTERLEDEIGIILGEEKGDGRIKVQYVSPGSRADRAGLSGNDHIVSIGGRPAVYMGMFDAVSILLSAPEGSTRLIVDREVVFFVETSGEEGPASDLWDAAGLSIENGPEGAYVSDISPDSSAFGRGVRVGDQIIKLMGNEMSGMTITEVRDAIRGGGPHSVDMFIRRKITI